MYSYLVPHDGWSMRVIAVLSVTRYLQAVPQLPHVQILWSYREYRWSLNYL